MADHDPGHTNQDLTVLAETDDGVVACTHAWWRADRTPEVDPGADDQAALEVSRRRILEMADLGGTRPRRAVPTERRARRLASAGSGLDPGPARACGPGRAAMTTVAPHTATSTRLAMVMAGAAAQTGCAEGDDPARQPGADRDAEGVGQLRTDGCGAFRPGLGGLDHTVVAVEYASPIPSPATAQAAAATQIGSDVIGMAASMPIPTPMRIAPLTSSQVRDPRAANWPAATSRWPSHRCRGQRQAAGHRAGAARRCHRQRHEGLRPRGRRR